MSRKPALRTGSFVLRAAKIIAPIGRRSYPRFLQGSPDGGTLNKVTLYAFYDRRTLWSGWQFHTSRNSLHVGTPKARLVVFVSRDLWKPSCLQDLSAVRIESKTPQTVWGIPIYAGLDVVREYYRAVLDKLEGQPQARRRLEAVLRAWEE